MCVAQVLDNLPHSILAFWADERPIADGDRGVFCVSGGHPGWPAVRVVGELYQRFLEQYRITEEEVPLVSLSWDHAGGVLASLVEA